MHDVETIFHLSYVLTVLEIFPEIWVMPVMPGHHSYFRKDFQRLFTLTEGYI